MPIPTAPAFTKLTRALLALLFAVATTAAVAQERPRRQGPPASEQRQGEQQQGEQRQAQRPQGDGVLRLLPPDAVTQHTVDTPGGKLDYTATAGTLSLFDQSGERTAAIFYTAYVAKSADAGKRPLTFVFNGGPGAASAFLHLGLVGPRIAVFGMSGRDAAATRLEDNPDTWLAFTDLVLIDPVGTGWSKPAKADGGNAFWGVRRDAESLAKAIALYVAKNDRAASPKYHPGRELWRLPRRQGGARAATRPGHRDRRHRDGVAAAGRRAHLRRHPLRAWGRRLQLPSLAASELERKGAFSKEKLAEAERFALTEYLTTLAGPAADQGDAARAFYARVAQITGLPEDVVTQVARLHPRRLCEESALRRRQDRQPLRRDLCGRPIPFPEQETARGPDPLLDGVTRAYGGAFAGYARDELGFKTEMTYVLLASDIAGKWDWGEGSGRAGRASPRTCACNSRSSPSFRLLIAHGYSDMVTPYAASRYVLDHLPPIGDPARAQLKLYRGGHMFYLDPGRAAPSAPTPRRSIRSREGNRS